MPDEMEQQQQQPVPSYQKLGLGAKFVMELKQRIAVASKLSKLEKVKALHTDTIKAMFVKALLQVDTNPTDEDFKDLVKALPDMGAMCSVIGYKVGIIPGKRSAIDATKLRLKLTDYNLTMEEIDTIVKESTIESTWGEFSAELLNPNGAKKKVHRKFTPVQRKPLHPPTPVTRPKLPHAGGGFDVGKPAKMVVKTLAKPKAPAESKTKAPTRSKKG